MGFFPKVLFFLKLVSNIEERRNVKTKYLYFKTEVEGEKDRDRRSGEMIDKSDIKSYISIRRAMHINQV